MAKLAEATTPEARSAVLLALDVMRGGRAVASIEKGDGSLTVRFARGAVCDERLTDLGRALKGFLGKKP